MWTPKAWNIRYNLKAVHDGRQTIPLLYEPFDKMLITASETVWKHDASIQEGNNLQGWGGGGGGGEETLEIVKEKREKGQRKIRRQGRLGGKYLQR